MNGSLVGLLGSGEFLPWAAEVDRFLLDRTTAGDGTVAIVAAASAPEGEDVFQRWATMGVEHYRSIGVDAALVPIRTRDDASEPAAVAMAERASLVFFSGGNPAYLARTMEGTPFWEATVDAVRAGASVAGCSAGACIFGDVAPDPTMMDSPDALRQPGLGVFKGYVFGAHWDALNTFYPGLQQLVLSTVPPGSTMIGIDEDTAMTSDGERWHVAGRAGVHVLAGESAVSYGAGDTFTLP